jgi:hypothetical protein
MNDLTKTFALTAILLLTSNISISAQVKRGKAAPTKIVKPSTIKQKAYVKRVPSSKVIYKTPQKKIVSVRNISNRTIVNHKGQKYYYANNRYYTQSRGSYIVIAPKIGFRINTLPANYKVVRFNNYNYYNANGIFYTQIDSEYEVVDPEVGTIVYELPDDYEKVVINEQTYYEYANILYEKIQIDGSRAYEVVGIIEIEG